MVPLVGMISRIKCRLETNELKYSGGWHGLLVARATIEMVNLQLRIFMQLGSSLKQLRSNILTF